MAAVNGQHPDALAATAPQLNASPQQHAPSVEWASRPTGYYAFSELMSLDRGYAQFKRFAKLNAHSLLIQQAELLYLESELYTIAAHDERSGLEHSRSVKSLLDSAEADRDNEQWELILRIRTKLKDYNEALIQQSSIWDLPPPRKSDTRFLRGWLVDKDGGNIFLKGQEALPFYEDQYSDLLTVSERRFDSFSALIAEKVLPWAVNVGLVKKSAIPGHEAAGISIWPDSYFLRATQSIVVVASALIPSLAILILYFVPSTLARIFVAIALSLLFSLSLAIATIARPVEVFAATAVFAAVQVVFIASTGTNSM